MSYTEKIDVLDLLINILREHEEKLDELVERLEIVSQVIQQHPTLKRSLLEYGEGEVTEERQLENEVTSILVVDDDKNLANTFQLVLQSVGFTVETASTGLQALYKAKKKEYQLVILDINLPDMLGGEVAAKLLEDDEDLNIIMITGYASFKNELNGSDLDIKEILMKPIPPEDLVKITKKTLLKKKQ